MSKSKSITIAGARTHNLNNLSVEIPREKITVVTGPSGSGKTSLAVDTLFAEAQHRFMGTFSGFARQVLDLMDRPDVDGISGLSPAVCVNQKRSRGTVRSTAGTLSGAYDLLRLLFGQVGHRHSPVTGERLRRHTVQEIVDSLTGLAGSGLGEEVKIQLMAPVAVTKDRGVETAMKEYLKQGYIRFRMNGEMMIPEDYAGTKTGRQGKKAGKRTSRSLATVANSTTGQPESLEVVVDRLVMKRHPANPEQARRRLTDSVELALKLGNGTLMVNLPERKEDRTYHNLYRDPADNTVYPELTPGCFSFNSHEGACPECRGLGLTQPRKSPRRGRSVDRETPEEEPEFSGRVCPTCGGLRLNPSSLAVTVLGRNIADCCAQPIAALANWAAEAMQRNRTHDTEGLSQREGRIAAPILTLLQKSLDLLTKMGLSYLCLNRRADTLSGGEIQRIRIAGHISAGLTGVLYVLDEPSMGLHPADMADMLKALRDLRDNGNTVVAVEHDSDTILSADYVVEIGPEAGARGGRLMFQGRPGKLLKTDTATGRYLGSRKSNLRREINTAVKSMNLPTLFQRPRQPLELRGASCHNLKSVTVQIPLGRFIAVTGVSGSGKSTLVHHILYPALTGKAPPAGDGTAVVTKILKPVTDLSTVLVTQSPIGRTSRSNPATFTGMFDSIRRLFGETMDSKIRGYGAGRFSFNTPGGRCETCRGEGVQKTDMHFLDDITMRCDTCGGSRFNRDTLQIRFKGINIAEVLEMTVEEAAVFFRNIPRIRDKLKMLSDVGLGYLKLGQPGPELSGGEAQRLKLATELAKAGLQHTIYLLDEPSTGLHFEDIKKLLVLLHSLVKQGNTVIVVEHQSDIILASDWIVDLGPGAGPDGGRVMAMGPPEKLLQTAESKTARFLKKNLSEPP